MNGYLPSLLATIAPITVGQPENLLRVGSESLVEFYTNYVVTGDLLELSGESLTKQSFKYVASGQLELIGGFTYGVSNYSYEPSGLLELSGESLTVESNIYNYEAAGILELSGESICIPKGFFTYEATGSLRLFGKAYPYFTEKHKRKASSTSSKNPTLTTMRDRGVLLKWKTLDDSARRRKTFVGAKTDIRYITN